jgi:hypothetical protein
MKMGSINTRIKVQAVLAKVKYYLQKSQNKKGLDAQLKQQSACLTSIEKP